MMDILSCIIILIAFPIESYAVGTGSQSTLEPIVKPSSPRIFEPLRQFLNSPRNLQILLNGEPIRYSFIPQIGNRKYVVKNLLTAWDNTYCYQGHMEGNADDLILIKVFRNSPESYFEELERAAIDKYIVLLDHDEKNRILVEKHYRSFSVVVGKTHYFLLRMLEGTPQTSVYLGHIIGDDPSNRLILKFYKKDTEPYSYYMKEVNCMKNLGRLIDFTEDKSKYSIVEKFMPGRHLIDVLNDANIEKGVILDKCQIQLNKIHKKLKMSINNIKPYNVILSDDGEVNFLDFSKAEQLPSDDVLASAARLKDIKDLMLIFRRRMPRVSSSPF